MMLADVLIIGGAVVAVGSAFFILDWLGDLVLWGIRCWRDHRDRREAA